MRNFVKDVNNVAESLNCDPRKVCELMERDYQEYIDAVAIIEDDLEQAGAKKIKGNLAPFT